MIHRHAPAGDFASPCAMWQTYRALRRTGAGGLSAVLQETLNSEFGGTRTSLFSSGSAALVALLRQLRLQLGINNVVVGAYTCPDTVSAALAAGCSVSLVDISEQTMEPLFDSARSYPKPAVMLLSNLYGIPDALLPWVDNFDVVVDDGCQAYLSSTPEGRVGLRSGVVGVLSFGRGKALSGAGGGAIIMSTTTPLRIAQVLDNNQMHLPSVPNFISPILRASASWLLERPSLYWIPASFPVLGLGAVQVKESVTLAGCSSGSALIMLAQLKRREVISSRCVKIARLWHEALRGLPLVEPFIQRRFTFDGSVVPNRYPILLPTAELRKSMEIKLRRIGLGVSCSYGKSIAEFFPGLVKPTELPGASAVAERLLTLPTHRYVTHQDINMAAKIFRKELGGA